ncbi:MAG: hypothetical protein JWR78_2724 [Mycobacterium sp.]|jgi:hypothetical protein|nr:hypothetical protein [Mycobacterium sp.]
MDDDCLTGISTGISRDMGYQVTEVQRYLKGFDYPGSPQDLAEHARRNGADDDLVSALQSLDKDSFDGPSAVMQALGAEDALGGS